MIHNKTFNFIYLSFTLVRALQKRKKERKKKRKNSLQTHHIMLPSSFSSSSYTQKNRLSWTIKEMETKKTRGRVGWKLECTPVIWTLFRRMVFWRDLKRGRGAKWIRVIEWEWTTGATYWVKPCMPLLTETEIIAAIHGIKPLELLRIVTKILAATYGVKPCEFIITVAKIFAATYGIKPCEFIITKAEILTATYGIKPCEFIIIAKAKILTATYGIKSRKPLWLWRISTFVPEGIKPWRVKEMIPRLTVPGRIFELGNWSCRHWIIKSKWAFCLERVIRMCRSCSDGVYTKIIRFEEISLLEVRVLQNRT